LKQSGDIKAFAVVHDCDFGMGHQIRSQPVC
jgi:hypothetical protein